MKPLPFWPIAWTLAIFATVVFSLDMLLGILFPNWWVMQNLYELLLPGFTFISWGAFFLGLVESFAGGFLTAVLFVPCTTTSPAGRQARLQKQRPRRWCPLITKRTGCEGG